MKKNKYNPQPISTESIALSADLVELTEMMARNVHDVWARSRMNEGWIYGPVRNDELKQHPCLVPYEELTESEREYDRNTAIETLKLILKSGFEITKK